MITVAVASYNHSKYVERCLRSIVEQDYDDVELCWVDDCSRDNTYEILNRLIKSKAIRNRFRSISIRKNTYNRGAAYSLNLACRIGTGKIISLMNSDDYYENDRLSAFMKSYNEEHNWFAFSNVRPVDDDGNDFYNDPTGERVAFDPEILVDRFGCVSLALLNRQIGSSTGNFLFTRRLFESIGGFVDLKYCHDWMFAVHATRFCEPYFMRRRLYNYRLHPTNSFRSLGSIAASETEQVLLSFFRAIALKPPENPDSLCLRRQPAGFWEAVEATGTKSFAERTFFPYLKNTRILSV